MLLQKPRRGGASDAGSSGAVTPPEQRHRARVAGSSGAVPPPEPRHRARVAGSSGAAPPPEQRHRARVAGSSGAVLPPEQRHRARVAGSIGAVPRVAGLSSGRLSQKAAPLPKHGAKEAFSTAKVKVQPKKLLKDLSVERPQKHQAEQEAVRGAITEKPPNSSKSHAKAHLSSEVTDLQEANDEIHKLNQLGLGEDISPDEFLKYFKRLPNEPSINLYTKLDDKLLTPLYERHARYRLKYLKLSQNPSKDKLYAELKEHKALDLPEKDLSEELLRKMRYFEHFEMDGSLDWFFDPRFCRIQALDDYQRLIVRNHGGFEFANWDEYCNFFHSYETDEEYLDYCKELSKKLKWMEGYVQMDRSSLKWDKISTRGAYQAIKIATGFSKITRGLAYIGYYECLENMRFLAFWLKDLDGVYFEIWVRVTKQKKSFRNALEEVYKLNKFPSRQHRMKYALEYGNIYSDVEMEFCTCTAGVPSDVAEDIAHKLIAEAVKKVERPVLYEHYVRKKIAIAQSIGLITEVQQPSARSGQQVEV